MANIPNVGDSVTEFQEQLQTLKCRPSLIDMSKELLVQRKVATLKLPMDAQEKMQEIEKQIVDVEKEICHLTKEIKGKEEEFEDLGKKLNENHEAYTSEAKLYYTISGITWDLDKMPNEIVGYTTHNELKTFALDSANHPQFFITNHLWNLFNKEN